MGEPKKIYCPQCGHKALTYDGRATVNITARCRKCNKTVVYIPSTDEVKITSIPERTTASGGFCW